MASFDIVCEVNMQEVTNGVDQARREIVNRYDFRGSNCEISLDKNKEPFTIKKYSKNQIVGAEQILSGINNLSIAASSEVILN